MKVVIVAKTRMGSGACVGGVTFEGRSLRLIAPDVEENSAFNMEYQLGDVWEIEDYDLPPLKPPHVENIVVQRKRRLPPIDELAAFVEERMPPLSGGLDVLFEGMAQHTAGGVLYIAERCGVPAASTMFWRPDRSLQLDDSGKRIRYRYPTPDGGRTLTFVGFQEPLREIPAGVLLRVSLAHWWQPPDRPDREPRCYVQLSGWLDDSPRWPDNPFAATEFDNSLPLPLPPEPFDLDEISSARQASRGRPERGRVWTNPVAAEVGQLPPVERARHVLKHVFGFDDYRPLQEEIVARLLRGKDALAVMPTGSGKSLCFQLPALLLEGLTVVVSPLIALMQDQVEQLRELAIPAAFLNSTLSYEGYLDTVQAIRAGEIKLLYAAPETLLRPETLHLLEQSRVSCLAIDEAHCISEWGHDFRPEYRQLAAVRARLPQAACLAVTATATERVRQDILQSLAIPRAAQFLASFDRENLQLRVEPRTDGLAQMQQFLQGHRGQAGIIYCSTRNLVDSLAASLQAQGWPALPYHAGLDDETRRRNQRRFTHGEETIIVATIAFGMGINKPNVRFVLHYDLPKNLDSYYQQIGRAGRDGLPAECLLLFAYNDIQTINFFIQQETLEQQRGARWRLDAMLAYAETKGCRRAPLLGYFGEAYEAERCDQCDNCLNQEEGGQDDLTIAAQKFLSCVKRTGEIFGMSHVIDVLRGSQSQKVLSRRHDRLSTYGIGGEFSKKDWQYLARQFIQQGLLEQDMEHGSLRLTPLAYEVFRGKEVRGTLPDAAPAARASAAPQDYDGELFALLRAHRLALAEAASVPPYVIFSDRTLAEMATYYPQSPDSMLQMHGVGDLKLAKYADEFLPIIRRYCQERGLAVRARGVPGSAPAASRRPAVNRQTEITQWYNGGLSVADISHQKGIKADTVVQHLLRAALGGADLRPDGIRELSALPVALQEQALAAFAQHGPELLRPVYDALAGEVDWTELRILQLYYLAQQSGQR